MTLHYYPETDSLYIALRAGPGIETREILSGLRADFDASGNAIGFDIDHASRTVDLSIVNIIGLPQELSHS